MRNKEKSQEGKVVTLISFGWNLIVYNAAAFVRKAKAGARFLSEMMVELCDGIRPAGGC
ncbi:hypothetical protein [Amphritea sp. HPY]|uniref:hypothetical protein n=1 Tax=Amphritea sp. HPY TaxID=3421652 RepID=UPI003D7EEFED